ncbi:MAG TPA: hypothetical protein VER08_02450 [Pyrinomonadaceae bacterium]|nr:hypothetical protein [Pyrinomonadaceae bacterium]
MLFPLVARQGCGRCGAGVPVWSDVCQSCGNVLHAARRLRAAGVLYIFLGLALTGGTVYLLAAITRMVLYPDGSGRYTGGVWGLVLVYGLLGFVLTIGVTGLLMGTWQVVYGRRNLKLVRVAIVLYVIFIAAGLAVRLLS